MLGLKYEHGASKVSKTPEPFVTPKSVLVVALGCLGMCLFGHILHTQHEQRMAHTAALHHRQEIIEKELAEKLAPKPEPPKAAVQETPPKVAVVPPPEPPKVAAVPPPEQPKPQEKPQEPVKVVDAQPKPQEQLQHKPQEPLQEKPLAQEKPQEPVQEKTQEAPKVEAQEKPPWDSRDPETNGLKEPLKPLKEEVPERLASIEANKVHEPVSFKPGYLTPELYEKCNPSVGYMLYEVVGGPNNLNTGKGADSALDSGRCGVDEASAIREALDRNKFDFQSVTPTPYIFPPFLQSAMLDLQRSGKALNWLLRVALEAHERNGTGDETLLAQFFTWGIPVPSHRLRLILGDPAIQALARCHAIRACASEPGLWFSSVQLFPVPMTGVIVANDFPALNYEMSHAPVGITTVESLGLTHNAPLVRGSVLDMSSGNGVHGIVAAVRGAQSVVYVNQNPRALRFAQFSAYLNNVGQKMTFTQGIEYAMGSEPTFNFELLLANPKYEPTLFDDGEMSLREAIRVAASFLERNGSFAFVAEIPDPRNLPNRFCAEMGLSGFSGAVVFRNPPVDAQTYAQTATFRLDPPTDLTGPEMQDLKGVPELEGPWPDATPIDRAARLLSLGVHEVSEGIVYGWRTPKNVTDHGCGIWDWAGLPDPWDREMGKTLEQRSCFHSQHKRESCPHVL